MKIGLTLWGFAVGARGAVDLAVLAEQPGRRRPRRAMSAVSDRLLDEVLLVGPAGRCREQLEAFRAAGVEWATLGPQRVSDQDLLQQARRVAIELAPR